MKYWVCLLGAAALYGQVAEGNVVDGVTGSPVAGTYITVSAPGVPTTPMARSDLGGHFRIAIGPQESERLMLVVSSAGYLRYSYLLPPPSSPEFSSLRITLTPQAVITGRIEDEDGYPVPGGFVAVCKYPVTNGRSSTQTFGLTVSSDLGEYRVSGLPAGRYYVRTWNMWLLTDWDARYSPEFYGGTLTPVESNMVDIKAGEVRSGVDLHLKRREGVSISARLAAPASWGKSEQGRVSLDGEFGFSRSALPQSDGTFLLPHVTQGRYTISATARFPAIDRTPNVQQPVEVSDVGIRDLVLNFESSTGATVTGQILSDGLTPACPYAIGLRAANGVPTGARSSQDGTFSIQGLKPGRYRLMIQAEQADVQAPKCETLPLSARLGGEDVLAAGFDVGTTMVGPLQILVTSKLGTLTGSLVDAAGRPVAAQLIFEETSSGRLASTFTQAGKFSRLFIPGNYHVYAATNAQQSQALSQPPYRAQHANDLPIVRIVEGSNTPITLTLH